MTTELIAALEAAEGPSRELDRKIAAIAGWHRVEPRFTRNHKHGAWIAPEDFIGVMSDGSPILDSLHGTTLHREVPPYTSSIDAALTLVPDGWGWELRGSGYANLMHPDHRQCDTEGYAATPATALVIAALRAKGDV